MFVFIILWVRAEPSWMSFPLPFVLLLITSHRDRLDLVLLRRFE